MTLTLLTDGTGPLPGQTAVSRHYQVSNPGAGKDWTLTVPAGEKWEVQAVYAQFTASATVASRTCSIFAGPSITPIYLVPGAVAVTAGGAQVFVWALGVATVSTGIRTVTAIPEMLLQPSTVFASFTDNLQAGDTWAPIFVQVLAYT